MPTQPAILGMARLGNVRLGYVTTALTTVRRTRVKVLLAGVPSRLRIRQQGLTIHDAINDQPNTCGLMVDTTAPTSGQSLRVLINSDTPRLLFNGVLQTVDLRYEGLPAQLAWSCTAIDDLERLNRRRPFGAWTSISATTVAQAIVSTYAPDFSAAGIAASLPSVSVNFDGSEGFSGCLRQLAKLIGGYFYVEDLVVHLFQTEATDPPDPIDVSHPFLDDPPITMRVDTAQLQTRVYGKGYGTAVLCDVAAGETDIPLGDVVMFNPDGGHAITGITADGSQVQVIAYEKVQLGGGGSLVGTGATPSTAPAVTAAAGTGLGTGVYGYAYTFVTVAGETLVSPVATITTGVLAAPTAAPAWGGSGSGGLGLGFYAYAVTFINAAGETTEGPSLTVHNLAGQSNLLTGIGVGPSSTTSRGLYRTIADGAQLKLVTTLADNTTTIYTDATADGSLGANVPTSNTATTKQAAVAGIALGASPTTQRKLYRTAVGASQLQLLTTIADNTTTTYLDSTADGSLGANAPSSDTSGLQQPSGQVLAGSTAIFTASAAPFPMSGWAVVGSGTVRYTGITGNTLTGVPASGPGSLATSVVYGSQILPASSLIGVTGLTLGMAKGARVSIWVQRDDLAAQAAQAAIDLANGLSSADGIYEGPPLVDERRGEASLIALCDATLALYAAPIVTVTYATRDVKTKSGKPITITLATPPISQTLTIQDVTITELDVAAGTAPRFTVTASNVRFSLEAWLRAMATAITA